MELDHLKAFVAASEELHFSRAAKRLHLSQPALSKQIQQLEEELGLKLFIRNRRSVQLSQEGEFLLEKVKLTLSCADIVKATATQMAKGEEGILRIAFTSTAPQAILPELIRAYRKRAPKVSLELTEQSSRLQIQSLLRSEIDIGIFRPDLSAGSKGICHHQIFSESFVVALAHDHPLANRKILSIAQLKDESWLMVRRESSSAVYDTILASCQKAGYYPNILQSFSQVQGVLSMVAAGLGIAVLPESARQLKLKKLNFVRLSGALKTQLVLGTREGELPAHLSAFLQVASKFAGC